MKKILAAMLLIGCIAGWVGTAGNGVPILAYHQVGENDDIYSVPAGQFAEQMKYLQASGYTAVSLGELAAAQQGQGTLPIRPVVITFDDGYEDNLLAAVPIMEQYGMKGTVFVVPKLVGTYEYLTWEQVRELKQHNTEIGSHTLNHVDLATLPPQEQQKELTESRRILTQEAGEVKFLAYPYGSFNQDTRRLLAQTGYHGACTGLPGLNDAKTDPYVWKRINMPKPRFGLWEFKLRLLRANIYYKLGI